jgi:hypothetical protein
MATFENKNKDLNSAPQPGIFHKKVIWQYKIDGTIFSTFILLN